MRNSALLLFAVIAASTSLLHGQTESQQEFPWSSRSGVQPLVSPDLIRNNAPQPIAQVKNRPAPQERTSVAIPQPVTPVVSLAPPTVTIAKPRVPIPAKPRVPTLATSVVIPAPATSVVTPATPVVTMVTPAATPVTSDVKPMKSVLSIVMAIEANKGRVAPKPIAYDRSSLLANSEPPKKKRPPFPVRQSPFRFRK